MPTKWTGRGASAAAVFGVTLCGFGFLLFSVKPLPQLLLLGFVGLAFGSGQLMGERVSRISLKVELALVTTLGLAFSCSELTARFSVSGQQPAGMPIGPSLLGLLVGLVLSVAAWSILARSYAATKRARTVLQLTYVVTAATVILASRFWATC